MRGAIRRAVSGLTIGDDAQRHFDLAAERIQHALLEVSIPVTPGVQIGVHAEPARLVGGDYVDMFLAEDGPLVVGLGDASGKSLAAALNALMLRYLVRGLVAALGTQKLPEIVTHTNRVLIGDMEEDAFITFVLVALDIAGENLRVVNAGHEPPMILRAGADSVETLDLHDIVLGVERTTDYVEDSCRLRRGDLVMFYTDGLTEASSAKGEMYTINRLKETLLAKRGLDAQALTDAIYDDVKVFSGGNMRDDATVVAIRRI
jgi:sigma-B regulation protein RsbU (phosphoserine phosphatase)